MAMSTVMSEPSESDRGPWGLWATAGLSLLTYLLYFAAGFGVMIAVSASYLIDNPELDH